MSANRIDKLFQDPKHKVLSCYITAGFPALGDTLPLCEALQAAGVSMIEIGFPFSDPLADGPTIQRSSETALKNGMTLKVLFAQLAEVRKRVSVPLLLMGYLNPVLQFGAERFCEEAERCGIDGVILPDLPFADYARRYKAVFDRYGLKVVFLVTPSTSEARLAEIDAAASGFIYAVSSPSVTGSTLTLDEPTKRYFGRLKAARLKNPLLIGFGIHDRDGFARACDHARGAIIGSALIRSLQKGGDAAANAKAFVREILEAAA